MALLYLKNVNASFKITSIGEWDFCISIVLRKEWKESAEVYVAVQSSIKEAIKARFKVC